MRCGSDIGKQCVAAELDRKGSEGVSPDIDSDCAGSRHRGVADRRGCCKVGNPGSSWCTKSFSTEACKVLECSQNSYLNL